MLKNRTLDLNAEPDVTACPPKPLGSDMKRADDGRYYLLSAFKVAWADAEWYCVSRGMQLAKITDYRWQQNFAPLYGKHICN